MTIVHDGFSVTRRVILKGAGVVALVGLGNIPFSLAPAFAAANDKYPEEAFKAKSEADAVKALYGKTAEASDKVKLDAPEIAENGAVVPVSVTTTLPDVTSISFLVSENPVVLVASYKIPAGTLPRVGNRIKMAKPSNVICAAAAARTRDQENGIDHSRARHFVRRDHRSAGPDPAPDGFRLRQGRQGRDHSAPLHPAIDLRI